MNEPLRHVNRVLCALGIDMARLLRSPMELPAYLRDRRELKHQMSTAGVRIPFGSPWPCLTDRYAQAGTLSHNYFMQDLLVAQKIHARNPLRHVDVGSRVDGFVAHVAAFREIEVLDVRPLPMTITNVRFIQCDITATLPPELDQCCDSLSCLHALEHFGLGRYGDPVHYDGHIRGLYNLRAMLKPNGRLYLSVPIGPLRIEFNSQRVFSVEYLLKMFEDLRLCIESLTLLDDEDQLVENAELSSVNIHSNFRCRCGCGIFVLTTTF